MLYGQAACCAQDLQLLAADTNCWCKRVCHRLGTSQIIQYNLGPCPRFLILQQACCLLRRLDTVALKASLPVVTFVAVEVALHGPPQQHHGRPHGVRYHAWAAQLSLFAESCNSSMDYLVLLYIEWFAWRPCSDVCTVIGLHAFA